MVYHSSIGSYFFFLSGTENNGVNYNLQAADSLKHKITASDNSVAVKGKNGFILFYRWRKDVSKM